MNYQEALDYINETRWDSIRFGLERTAELLERLGSPEKELKFVHTAGSNGKGSTCAMIESVLRAAGYRTGFYLSPFVEDFRETFQVCGEPVTDPERDVRLVRKSLDGQVFEWKGMELPLKLLGEHQLKNAAVALAAVEALQRRGSRRSSGKWANRRKALKISKRRYENASLMAVPPSAALRCIFPDR